MLSLIIKCCYPYKFRYDEFKIIKLYLYLAYFFILVYYKNYYILDILCICVNMDMCVFVYIMDILLFYIYMYVIVM